MHTTSSDHEPCGNPDCVIGRNERPFSMPDRLFDAAVNRRLVIFAGAGVSTEARTVLKTTLYDDVMRELGLPRDTRLSFPSLMSRYCSQPDGRAKLIQQVHERFRAIQAFPELYRQATRFHRELATIPHITDIVTTNWDDYFERECGAIPVVTAPDFVFWNLPNRKVYKIHGSIGNYGGLVATEADYKRCYRNLSRGLVGSNLKMLLATRTALFVGYSFGDYDFKQIYGLLKRELSDLLPQSYMVTVDSNVASNLASEGVTPIVTDATFFARTLKARLVEAGLMLADNKFAAMELFLQAVMHEHNRLRSSVKLREHPESLYAFCYQDGLAHAAEYVLENAKTGSCSDPCRIHKVVQSYEVIRKAKLKAKRYEDVAYIEGYQNGLIYLLSERDQGPEPPMYYVFGVGGVEDWDRYQELLPEAPTLHKDAHDFAKRHASKLESSRSEIHHPPWL